MASMPQGGLDIESVITYHYAIGEYLPAFELVESGQTGKVILHWDD